MSATKKLAEAVELLTAGEDRLAAQLEDIIQQIEISALESEAPPNAR